MALTLVSTGGNTTGSTGWSYPVRAYDSDLSTQASAAISQNGSDCTLRYNFASGTHKVNRVILKTGTVADSGLTVRIYIGGTYTGASNDIALSDNANATITKDLTLGSVTAATYCDLILHRTDNVYTSSLYAYLKEVELYEDTGPVLPGSFSLTSPLDNETGVVTNPTFTWTAATGAASYTLVVDNNSDFSSPVFNQNVGNVTSYQVTGLSNATVYYWKVTATNSDGDTAASNNGIDFTVTSGFPQVETLITGGNTTGSTALNPNYAFDGSPSTYTTTMDYATGLSDLYYNFPAPHKIYKIVFNLAYCNGASGEAVFTKFYLGGQDIGDHAYTYGQSGTYTYYPDMSGKVAASYFRINVTGDSGSTPWIDIYEIQLYDMMDAPLSASDSDAFWF